MRDMLVDTALQGKDCIGWILLEGNNGCCLPRWFGAACLFQLAITYGLLVPGEHPTAPPVHANCDLWSVAFLHSSFGVSPVDGEILAQMQGASRFVSPAIDERCCKFFQL